MARKKNNTMILTSEEAEKDVEEGRDLEGLIIDGEVVFQGQVIDRDLAFRGVIIKGPLYFDSASIKGDLIFEGVVIEDELDLTKATIEGDLVFRGIIIKEWLSLEGIVVKGNFDFPAIGVAKIDVDQKNAQRVHLADPNVPLVVGP